MAKQNALYYAGIFRVKAGRFKISATHWNTLFVLLKW